jgi:2',3'-cyclic-nucleotide 2'-phosphodiesterase (5'-nucleotidase family)
LVCLIAVLSLFFGRSPGTQAASAREFTILAINDVYRIEGLNDGRGGGLARVRALRRSLEAASPVLFLHAGDFLYPSLLSDRYDGEQMVDVMNLMDGDPECFDDRMVVTFGNHEFDKARLSDAERLNRRMNQSQFDWLGSNIVFKRDSGGQPMVHSHQLRQQKIVEIAGIRVGLFSLTTDMVKPAYVESFEPPLAVAERISLQLREQGATVVVALTHLNVAEDEAILRRLGDQGPDLIIGGHEHHYIKHCVPSDAAVRCVLKADADAVSATVAHIAVGEDGPQLVATHRVRLDESAVQNSMVRARTDTWLKRYALEYCGAEQPGCLDRVIGRTAVELVAEEHRIRRFETNLGDWVADQMVEGYNRLAPSAEPATVALINSGSLRFNQNIPAGVITERDLKELLPYPVRLLKIQLSGRVLREVLEHSAAGWPGSGSWLQVSGIRFTHVPNANGEKIVHLRYSAANRGGAVGDSDRVWVVTSRFLRGNPEEGRCGDGYCMLMKIAPDRVVAPNPPIELKTILANALREAGEPGIAPRCDGRIRNSDNGCE